MYKTIAWARPNVKFLLFECFAEVWHDVWEECQERELLSPVKGSSSERMPGTFVPKAWCTKLRLCIRPCFHLKQYAWLIDLLMQLEMVVLFWVMLGASPSGWLVVTGRVFAGPIIIMFNRYTQFWPILIGRVLIHVVVVNSYVSWLWWNKFVLYNRFHSLP